MTELDPYAPPKEPRRKKRRKKRDEVEDVDLTPHHMSIPVMIVLEVVTFGLYSVVWYFQRKPAFEALRQEPLSPLGLLLGYGIAWSAGVHSALRPGAPFLTWIASFAGAILIYRAQRQISHVISSAAYARGLDVEFSPILIWFFGAVHLQHGLNRLATERAD